MDITLIILSFLLNLSFFTLVAWVVIKFAIRKRSFHFKIKSMLIIIVTSTILMTILYGRDKLFIDYYIGYALAFGAYGLLDHYLFTPMFNARMMIKMFGVKQPESENNSSNPPDS